MTKKRYLIRVEDELWDAVKKQAASDNLSVNELMAQILDRFVNGEFDPAILEAEKRKPKRRRKSD